MHRMCLVMQLRQRSLQKRAGRRIIRPLLVLRSSVSVALVELGTAADCFVVLPEMWLESRYAGFNRSIDTSSVRPLILIVKYLSDVERIGKGPS